MGKLLRLTEKLKQLTPERMEEELLVIVKRNEEAATNMNTDQLFQGQDAKGNNLPDYSERSVTAFGKPSGPMRLFDTGDFYRGFILRADKFPVVFESTDKKTGRIAELLAARDVNPDDIYGLQKQNLTDLSRNYILPELQKFVRDSIRL